VVASGVGNLRSARAGDLDGDGDNDVAIAVYGSNTVSWYQNDGAGNFGSARIITSNAAGAITLFIIDLDADGDNDVLSASELDDKIAWYENGGSGNFTTHNIATDADGARWVYARDLDMDGDIDVFSASRHDDKIAWYENDGAQNFTTHVISTDTDWGSSVFADDMDNDGDIDVLSASTLDGKIAWYEYVNEGTVYERSFMQDDSLRSYLLYVPDGYTGQEDWPLVINYHGLLTTPDFMIELTEMNAVADTGHFLIAYPQGLKVELAGFPTGFGWNLPGISSPDNNDDVAFTNALIDHIDADFAVDLSRVHATGWSNGSLFSFYLACELSDRIASVAGVAAPMSDSMLATCTYDRPVSSMLIAGTSDPIVPYSGLPGLTSFVPNTPSFWASQFNCSHDSVVTELPDLTTADSSTVTRFEYVNCDSVAEIVFYRVNNGGHTWPGGGTPTAAAPLGHVNRDISASSEIWNFFKRNPHPNPPVGIEDGISDVQPEAFALYDNYPNPFNPSTLIRFSLPKASQVDLQIFNVLGQSVRTLVSENLAAGEHTAVWDGKNDAGLALPSGTYFYRIKAGDFKAVKKMLLLK
jgi:poly(3-hydroxybutyrate) depolymerase